MRQHPGADPQEGRTLIRNARREHEQSKPPKYFRELFQWIKDVSAQGNDSDEPDAPEEGDHDDDET